MIAHKLPELLKDHICLVKYKKQNVIYHCYFTKNLKYTNALCKQPQNNEAFNLIKEEVELLDPSSVQAILCSSGSIADKIELSYNRSAQKIKKLKESTSSTVHKFLLSKLTNHRDLLFDNGLTAEDFLFILNSRSQYFKLNLKHIKNLFRMDCFNLSRSKIMISWFFGIETGISCNTTKIKHVFVKTLQDTITKEKDSIIKEWSHLTEEYPALFDTELSNLLKLLDKPLETLTKRIQNSPFLEDEVDLINYLSTNFWPKNIQPNPFSRLLGP